MPEPLEGEHEVRHELHLPGPSFAPIVLSAGVAIVLFGLVPDSRLWRLALVSIGVIVSAIAAMVWLREAIADYRDLPD
jgi:hypothetical protein